MNINPFRNACKYHREFEYPRTKERVKLFSAVTKLLFCSWRGVKRLMSIRCKCPKGRKLMPYAYDHWSTLSFFLYQPFSFFWRDEVVKCATYVNDWAFEQCDVFCLAEGWEKVKRTVLCFVYWKQNRPEKRLFYKYCVCQISFLFLFQICRNLCAMARFSLTVESNFSKSYVIERLWKMW